MTKIRLARAVPVLALVLLSACFGLRFRRAPELVAPQVAVTNIAAVEGSDPVPSVRVDLILSNPNNVPLEVNGMRFQVDVNGKLFLRGQTPQFVKVPRLGDAKLSVVVTAGVLEALRQVSAMGKGGDFSYRVSGDLFLKEPDSRVLPFRSEPPSN